MLILGSRGVLGSTIANHLGAEWNILGADVVPSQDSNNNYIRLPQHGSVADLSLCLYRGVSQHIGKKKLDAVICASGGWAGDVDPEIGSGGGEEEEEDYVKEAAGVVERMIRVNYYPVVAGSLVGQKFMNRGGGLLLIFVLDSFSLPYSNKHFLFQHSCGRPVHYDRGICGIITNTRNDSLRIKQSSSACKSKDLVALSL